MLYDSRLRLDPAKFLAEHWQRAPVLIRDAIANFSPAISADELAGLALEEDVESRIVEFVAERWQLQHGPFTEEDFHRPPPWTLLVQAVDHLVPEVAALRELFNFVPSWRMDDVMVSYAVDGGSVGPHFDNYDVFLLQGEGQRLWKVGPLCDSSTALVPHDDLRILSDFECQTEYLLNPGDMLYLPPGVAHWGVAQGPCTTFSIGFRAPRKTDMLSRWIDALLEQEPAAPFYTDAQQSAAVRPGEIRDEDRQRVIAQIKDELSRGDSDTWFGELVTEPRYDQSATPEEITAAHTLLRTGATRIALEPGGKLAWQQDATGIAVFANGVSIMAEKSSVPLLLSLCGGGCLIATDLQQALENEQSMRILNWLVECGCLNVE